MTDVLVPPVESADRMPTLEHGAIIARPCRYLDAYVEEHGLGLVCGPPTRYPDLSFVRQDRLPRNLDVDADFAPDLAVEIVSGSDTVRDVDTKVLQYLDSGVQMVWIIHPVLRTVDVHTRHQARALLTQSDDLVGDPVLPGWRIPVRAIFVR